MQLVVFCTASSKDEAKSLSKILVEARACACVNIVDDVTSSFFWDGSVQNERESLMIIKTSSRVYDRLERVIKKHHSYDVPEIIAMPIIKGSKDYLDWIEDMTKEG